jgi:hypothetical protein
MESDASKIISRTITYADGAMLSAARNERLRICSMVP